MDTARMYELAQNLGQVLPQTRENLGARRILETMLNEAMVFEDPFCYEVLFPAVGVGATVVGQILIENDANFRVLAGTYDVTVANGPETDATRNIPICNVQIRNTGTGRSFFNNALPINTVFGTGGRPFLWPTPKLMKMRSLLEFTVTNTSAATAYTNLHLILVGVKEYQFTEANGG